MNRFIDPLNDFGPALFGVQKPARYVGGEPDRAPSIAPDDARLRIALCFPDLYEIGMSNNAVRILYSLLNDRRESIVCERVFAPAPDFEALLKRSGVPLYTLESGIPLSECDLVAFSIGYELLATNILTVLERGGIPLESGERGDDCPIIIAGGPAATNPLPFGRFVDAVWIGEAEEGFAELMVQLAVMKAEGAGRSDMLKALGAHQAIWMKPEMREMLGLDSARKTIRAVYADFSNTLYLPSFPVPVLNPVQAHGVTEIMRGCPNGCRFCHAGYYYRPQRTRAPAIVEKEVEALVLDKGYREITLSSLSSGDYPGILELFGLLNERWASFRTSFQLPSLKIETFTLSLLEEISEVRKSGLTFAVETPLDSWQCTINKKVPFEKIVEILHLARARGFRSAKFYFMIGLPVPERGMREAEEIVRYIKRIAALEKMAIHVNVGTFVPKPHTPFEKEVQLSEEEAVACIGHIRRELKPLRNVDISYHPPFLSVLEGIISRGDERVGDLLLEAYRRGARLDAWEEFFDRDLWRGVLADFDKKNGDGAWQSILKWKRSGQVPWHGISMKISQAWLKREKQKAEAGELSKACTINCTERCGVCDKNISVVYYNIHANSKISKIIGSGSSQGVRELGEGRNIQIIASPMNRVHELRLIGVFSKRNKAVMYPLHSVSNAFSRALLRAGFPVSFSKGFNPQPRIELVPPLSMGVEGKNEVFLVYLETGHSILKSQTADAVMHEIAEFMADSGNSEGSKTLSDDIVNALNEKLPEGLCISSLRISDPVKNGTVTIGKALMAAEWEYWFKDEPTFLRAEAVLSEMHRNLQSLVSDSHLRAIRIVESVKQQSSMHLLKMHLANTDSKEEYPHAWLEQFSAARISCFAQDPRSGELIPLQDAL